MVILCAIIVEYATTFYSFFPLFKGGKRMYNFGCMKKKTSHSFPLLFFFVFEGDGIFYSYDTDNR